MDRIICIVGPTASGKTGLSVALAKALDAEIISCDSMQIYRGMDIGTAKVMPDEMNGVIHHMIDIADPREEFSVSRFVEMADRCLQDILSRGKYAVIVGGTGLYIDSLIAGRSFAPSPSTGKRQELEALAAREGIEAVIRMLEPVDPESARRLHPSDQKRIIRAMEVWLETGKSITQHNEETKKIPPKYRPIWLGLDFNRREDLYDRINLRVDLMMKAGLMEEIRRVLAQGLPERATALQAIGYKEALACLRGEMTEDEAADQIRLASRHYAKRQLTWFRKNPAVHWIFRDAGMTGKEVFSRALQIVSEFDKG